MLRQRVGDNEGLLQLNTMNANQRIKPAKRVLPLFSIWDYLFPPACPICDAIRLPEEPICCPECEEKLTTVGNCTCYSCGKPVGDPSIEYCYDCEKTRRSFDRGYAAFLYEDTIREAMMGFKFHDQPWRGEYFADRWAMMYREQMKIHKPELVIPVPVHREKLRKRGYNQAEILAKRIGERLHIPLCTKLLLRTKETVAQKKLNDIERKKNLIRAFSVDEKEWQRLLPRLKSKTVLLVDDIYTTGSTMDACTKVLKKAGVEKVICGSICIGSGY